MGYCAFEQRKLKLESNLTQDIIHEPITWSSYKSDKYLLTTNRRQYSKPGP